MAPKLVTMPEKQPDHPQQADCPLDMCPLATPFAVLRSQVDTLNKAIDRIETAVSRIPWVTISGMGLLILALLGVIFSLLHK